MDPGEILYQSKENIQPLTTGRITSQFGTALHAQSNTAAQQELRKQMEHYELQLLSYDGEDELAVWVEYLSWIEQSFPKGGKEGNFRTVLEKCLTKFKDATWYMQDPRLVKLWIKYIDLFSDKSPAEMYSMAHAHGIGTESALFYQCWAYEHEKCKNFKKADEILDLGMRNHAQPEEALQQSKRNLQAAVFSMTLYGTLPSPRRPDISERQVMTSLKTHGSKNQVRSVRTGNGVLRSNLPLLPQTQINTSNAKASPLKIFMEKEERDLSVPHQQLHSLPRAQVQNKENCLEPGQWTGSVGGRRQRNQPQPAPERRPPGFQVHTDEELPGGDPKAVLSLPAQHCMKVNALQPIKPSDHEVGLPSMFETKPFERPMYPKHLVYNGGREFSFEELRAIKYFKAEKAKKDRLRLESRETCKNTTPLGVVTHPDTSVAVECFDNQASSQLVDRNLVMRQEMRVSSQSSVTKSNLDSPQCKQVLDLNGSSQAINIERKIQHLSITSRDNIQVSRGVRFDNTSKPTMPTDVAGLKREYSPYDNKPRNSHLPHETDNGNELASPVQIIKSLKLDSEQLSSSSEVTTGNSETRLSEIRETTSLKTSYEYASQQGSAGYILHSSSNEPSPAHSQSMTVNMKEAMCMMNELWGSSGNTQSEQQAADQSEGPAQVLPQEHVPFKIFTDDDDDGNDANLPPHQLVPTSTGPASENIHSRTKPTFLITNYDDKVQNKENTSFQNLIVYEDEDDDPPVSIPAVASPGMTEAELETLAGTEGKENNPPGADRVQEPAEHRPLVGILQPSINVPFEPPVQNSEDSEFTNMTCITQAFNFPLMSSTPFHSHVAQRGTDADQSVSHVAQHGSDANQSVSPPDNFRSVSASEEVEQIKFEGQSEATSKVNLSIILENSKEFKSCSSSGSSNGCTRSTLYNNNSRWSATRENLSRHKEVTPSVKDLNEGSRTKHFHSIETKEELAFVHTKHKLYSLNGRSMAGEDSKVVFLEEEEEEVFVQNQHKELPAANVFSSPISKKAEISQNVEGRAATLHLAKTTNVSEAIISNVLNCDDNDVLVHFKDLKRIKDQTNISGSQGLGLGIKNEEPIESIDPFDQVLIAKLLENIGFPQNEPNCVEIGTNIQVLKLGSVSNLGNTVLTVDSVLGQGAYAKVMKATDSSGKAWALKIQKPSWIWELYITNEIQSRLESNSKLRRAFMKVEQCYLFPNGSALLYEFSKYGSLLTVVNKMKSSWQHKEVETLSIFWAIEMLRIVEELHRCQIIHGDIKPDNFLLRSMPSLSMDEPSLQLIDFGRGIDLTLFPPGTRFTKAVQTKCFQCVEMQTGRPWTYQTDLYNLASTIHTILFGDYMKVSCTDGCWFINANFPRYVNKPLWESFFTPLLNIESCDSMPDLGSIRRDLECELRGRDMSKTLAYFTNLMSRR